MARILIVEDEAPLREALAAYLTSRGHGVDQAADGEAGWRAFRDGRPDVVVLDRLLPLLSGEDLCRRIKGVSTVPVVVATSLVQEEAVLEGFALGAEDYVRKPFSLKEMAARIEARLPRKPSPAPGPRDPVTGLEADLGARRVTLGGRSIDLTPHEFDLLVLFLGQPGRTFRRDVLLDQVWGSEAVGDRTVDAHVKNLRAKLAAALGAEPPLETVYGQGYRWHP